MGSIAALKVDVDSVYEHKAAPVPTDDNKKATNKEADANGHLHDHSHDHNDNQEKSHNHDHNHGHEHNREHDHSHEHKHQQSHDHSHNHHHTSQNQQKIPKKEEHAISESKNNDARSHSHSHEHGHAHGHGRDSHKPNKKEKQQTPKKDKSEHKDNDEDDAHNHSHSHGNFHGHSHDHGHSHSNSGDGPLRNLPQIERMLLNSSRKYIPQKVADLAIQTFTELAIAEAFTHGTSSKNTVHFHEVGAIDSIVDVIGTLLALHHLSVQTVSCSRLPLGEGTVWTDHGQLPVPAFATMRLMIGMKTCRGPGETIGVVTGELVTPTAAALLRVLTGVADAQRSDDENDMKKVRVGRAPAFTPTSVGIGAGTKDFVKFPNVLRLIIGEEMLNEEGGRMQQAFAAIPLKNDKALSEISHATKNHANLGNHSVVKEQDIIINAKEISTTEDVSLQKSDTKLWNIEKLNMLQANLDDITAETLSYAIDLLLQNGAIDSWIEPIVMKKGRSAHTLNVLFRSGDGIDGKLMEVIFRHTTTLGIRIQRDIERASLHRKMVQVQTLYGVGNTEALNGIVNVKIGLLRDEVVSIKAEFEDCKAISQATGVPIKNIADCATKKAQEALQ